MRFVAVVGAGFDGDANAFLSALFAVANLNRVRDEGFWDCFEISAAFFFAWMANGGRYTASSTEFEVWPESVS
jgi:hypothetical protein